MSTFQQLLIDIENSPSGPSVAAIFDFRWHTHRRLFSHNLYPRTTQTRRSVRAPVCRIDAGHDQFWMISGALSGMMAINAQFMRGIAEETYHDLGRQLYNKEIARLVYPESRALVEAHKAKGHTVAIISSATPYQVNDAAADLGVKHVICSHLEVKHGKFTGGVVNPVCFGQGKVDAAESLASAFDADLNNSFFYSDSTDDLLLLKRVGYPRALNPSAAAKLPRWCRAMACCKVWLAAGAQPWRNSFAP